ncbi:MAG: hypothetical protein ACKVOQ_17595 [Cyclobacteriaceae bacterium]
MRIAFSILFSIATLEIFAQRIDTISCELELLTPLPKSVVEISGMVFTNQGLWVHNDSDNGPFILFMTDKGLVKTIKKVTNATNYDWEDIASNTSGDLFIGDIGNNTNTRKTFQIYKIANPLKTEEMRVSAEIIEFTYSDQTAFPPKNNRLIYDAEAMIYFKDSLFIFNKNRSIPFDGFVRFYKIPAIVGKHQAILADSIYLGGKSSLSNWITGADISRDGKKLALLSSDKIWVFENFKGSDFFKGSINLLRLNHFSQKEAICFDDKDNLFVADELFENVLGGNLYRLHIKK